MSQHHKHPLDPVTKEELEEAVAIFKASQHYDSNSKYRFITISNFEPKRKDMWDDSKNCFKSFEPNKSNSVAREVFIVLLNSTKERAQEAVVNLTNKSVTSFVTLPEGVQPAYTPQDYEDCERLVKNDPRMKEALAKRGITNTDEIMVDLWAQGRGFLEETEHPMKRIAKPILYARDESDTISYGYGRPIEGLTPVIDLHAQQIIDIEDRGLIPVAKKVSERKKESSQHHPDDEKNFLPLKPLDIVQPQGPSFVLDGYHVKWQGWDLHVGFNARDGLTLHALQFWDREQHKYRPVMYRASCAEMVVPYADASAPTYRRNAFDVGEEGLGFNANSLELGCDCLGVIRYLDAVINTSRGTANVIKNAICVHEEDYGVLWKHTDWRSGNSQVARCRRLSISSFATVANYDYGFYWYFYQDGTVSCEVKLTGILLPTGVHPHTKADDLHHSVLLKEGLSAPMHEHFFNFRLEMCVEHFKNSIYETNVESDTSSYNVQGNAFVARRTLLSRELAAQRDLNPPSGRYWTVVSHQHRNAVNQPVGYKLQPGENAWPYLHPLSPVSRRAGFLNHHLWVTRAEDHSEPRMLSPVGPYPNQVSFHGQGLPEWTMKGNRGLIDAPLVLWYTLGVLHIPRLEEWPIMPVVRASFSLIPECFFDQNPTLYLQRSAKL